MKKYFAALVMLLAVIPATAGTITFYSQAGLYYSVPSTNVNYPTYTTGPTVVVTPSPAWASAPVSPPAQWISYGPTGYSQSLWQAPSLINPAVTIWADADGSTPTFTANAPNLLSLTVYADDTAGVFLWDNTTSTLTELQPPLLNVGTTCSGGVIGCTPGEQLTATWSLPAGSYTLYFTDYQLGNGLTTFDNPMGLLFWGSDTTTPEPGAFLLVGGGLLALGGLLRRKLVRQ